MSEKVKLQFTLVVEYEADPDHYGTSDPMEMASIDQESYDSGMMSPDDFVDLSERDNGHVVQWIKAAPSDVRLRHSPELDKTLFSEPGNCIMRPVNRGRSE